MPKPLSASPLNLCSRKKYFTTVDDLCTSVISVTETLRLVTPLCKKIGVTRISNISYLDRLYIPNYVSVLPGTEDTIWVYSGKGQTNNHAKASAMMESIERFCSLGSKSSLNTINGTYGQLSKEYNKVLHPDEVIEPTSRAFNEKDSIIDFVQGYDLLKKEQVLVPAELVFSRYSAKSPSVNAFLYSHTNGLASGNVLEEAVCHALCEVIERDAVSIADLCSSSIPYTISKTEVNLRKSEDEFIDDSSLFQEVDISEIAERYKPLKFLVKRFSDEGLPLLIKDITQNDIGVPTFIASSFESITSDYGYYAKGYGTHPNAIIALIRAITELSQTRVGNIHGARDDLKKIKYNTNDKIHNRKWEFMHTSSSTLDGSSRRIQPISFHTIKTHVMEDILDEINHILNGLKHAGLKRVIIVDLTHPALQIPVVRAIVPGLETFEIAKLFTNTELFMGKRAKSFFQKICSTKMRS
jgi:ribosomal protein S12 methylthiotransferase accessory factor